MKDSMRLREIGPESIEVSAEDPGLRKVADELAFLLGADESGGFKLFHVMRKRGGGDAEASEHIAARGCGMMMTEHPEDLVAARVCKGLRDEVDLSLGEFGRLLCVHHRV
jgi:hypothetical protein